MTKTSRWIGYAAAASGALACTLLGLAMVPRFDIVNVAMLYLMVVVAVAMYFNRGAAIFSAVVCVAAFDIVFVPPQGTFTVHDLQYLLTFAIMLAVAWVISALIAARQRQEAARAEIAVRAETERIRSMLLASISHDLRTPLAVMAGASSTLVESGARMSGDEREALAASIYKQARNLSEQVAKVLQMTRLETGAMVPERDWSSLAEIAGSVLSRLGEKLAAHRLIVQLPGDLPLVRVDATLIDQALANLLENAAGHTPEGTLVRLRAYVDEDRLVVSVEDYGAGLDDRDMERVFAKFHRGVVEGRGGGVGLGLAICRAIVALHGGRTWAERIPAGGTAFRFSLPIDKAPESPREIADA